MVNSWSGGLGASVSWLLVLAVALAAASCGGSTQTASVSRPSENITVEDVEKALKFDSRVQDFDTDGARLIVNVNEFWISSPPGMQQGALRRWFNQWRDAHSDSPKGVEVVVKYDGTDVARASADKGVQLLGKPAGKSEGS